MIKVNLLKNHIGAEHIQVLGGILATHPTLKTLCGLEPDATEADLSNKGLTADDAMSLAQDLKVNSALIKLDISGNQLTGEYGRDMTGVKALAEALPKT